MMDKVTAASSVLRGIGAPVNQRTLGAMIGWFNAEGGHWNNSAHFNPLNTTQSAPGAVSINGVGVKSYSNWQQGINATVQTLKNGRYGGIIGALKQSNPQGFVRAISSSPWGTSGSTVAQTVSAALGQKYAAPSPGGLGASTQPGQPSVSTSFSGGGTDMNAAGIASLLQDAARKIPASGKVSNDDVLGRLVSNVESGNYTTPVQANTALNPALAKAAAQTHILGGAGGDINPLMHFTLGRVDMGVDATNATPGTPIRALNDSRVVGIIHNWYNGQPYVWMKILSGPNAGKFWYVAEQITRLPQIGQVIHRGAPVAVYAPTGTGIEAGWAAPDGRTLAQTTTGYHEGRATPAGKSFRNLL